MVRVPATRVLLTKFGKSPGLCNLYVNALCTTIRGAAHRVVKLQLNRCNVLGRGQDATSDQFAQTDVVFASQSLRKKFERISATGPIFVWVSEGAGTTPPDYDFVLREGPDGFDRAWTHADAVSTLAPGSQADETDACTFDDTDM